MSIDGSKAGDHLAIHATAVAIDGLALLIRGPSKAGKSSLALDLIAGSTLHLPVLLIGDDRILLRRVGEAVVAAPHPLIEGRIEKRGHGILSMPFLAQAPVHGLVDLDEERSCDLLGINFPSLSIVKGIRWSRRRVSVLTWFGATSTAHLPAKRRLDVDIPAKD